MQQQPRGAMLAVRMAAVDLEPRLSRGVTIAGLNAPELTVVSGPEDAVRALEAKLGEAGVGCRVLATSHAFHSALMDGALGPFRQVLGRVRLEPPSRPWISCLTGGWISPAQAVDPEYWVQQMRQPVRFSDGVRQLARDPSQVLLEVGPGHTLSGLVRQHRDRPSEQVVVASLGADPEQDVLSLLEALGRLWTAGVKPDWAALHGGERRRRVPLPTYPFERRRFWVDAPALPGEDGTLATAPAVEVAPSVRGDQDAGAGRASESAGGADESGVLGRVRAILSGASGIPRAEIDAALSFVELGFDSLLLTQVSGALEKDFGVPVTFRQLLEEFPTPQALSDHLEGLLGERSAPETSPPRAALPPAAGGPEAQAPPVPGARLGRDAAGNEAWFVPDPNRPGKYLQVSRK
jgi:acyl transferase domain-containing protein